MSGLLTGKYTLDINELIEVAWWAINNSSEAVIPTHVRPHQRYLIHSLWEVRNFHKEAWPNIEKDDLMQTTYLLWLEGGAAYDKIEKKQMSRKSYITRRIVWGLRDWYMKQLRIVHQYPYFYFQEEHPEFLLDLQFLVYGTHVHPYKLLTPFERYLIFLRYRQEKTILQISYKIQRSRFHTAKCLNRALDKLRRAVNAPEDTTGHRQSNEDGRRNHSRRAAIQEKGSGSRDSDSASEVGR